MECGARFDLADVGPGQVVCAKDNSGEEVPGLDGGGYSILKGTTVASGILV